eukprot:GHVN01008840.1.p1 GENE.GHVN01008840.1~~GHVN01008840.1.p1  ORF type:complete len:196 (+),score=32.40 GHVN01008840.1:91-678(+)
MSKNFLSVFVKFILDAKSVLPKSGDKSGVEVDWSVCDKWSDEEKKTFVRYCVFMCGFGPRGVGVRSHEDMLIECKPLREVVVGVTNGHVKYFCSYLVSETLVSVDDYPDWASCHVRGLWNGDESEVADDRVQTDIKGSYSDYGRGEFQTRLSSVNHRISFEQSEQEAASACGMSLANYREKVVREAKGREQQGGR